MSATEAHPVRGYSWPPFAPGHAMSLRHGVHSARTVDPVARDLVAGILTDRPDLTAYPEALSAWARAEARVLLAESWLAEHGMVDAKGKPRDLLRYVVQFERLAADMRKTLGLDPRSDAELQSERARATASVLDLDGVMAAGRAAVEANARSVATRADASELPPGADSGRETATEPPMPSDSDRPGDEP